jgi:hypothetical protein
VRGAEGFPLILLREGGGADGCGRRLAAGLSDVSKLAVRGSTPLLRFAAEDLAAHAAPA